MTGPQNDEEFEAYLRRRSMLSGRKLETLEPPAALDDIVLARARRAIETPSPVQRYHAPRWAFPVGLAATILLCVSVLLNVNLSRHRNSQEPTSEAKVAAQAPAAASPAAGATATPNADTVSASPEPAPRNPAARARQTADPQAWLKHIESLRAHGKVEEAEAEWKRFRQAFPAYPVPSPPSETGPPK